MSHQTSPAQRPQAAPRPAAPARPTHPPAAPQPATPLVPVALERTPRWHHLVPAGARNLLATWGWWQNPVPLKPSQHLMQVITVLEQYGWCQSLDFSPTGRMCIRGAQKFLLHTGYVTPAAAKQAVAYMQQTLHENGFHQPFFAWNDLDERTLDEVKQLITAAARTAHANGE